MKKIGLVAWSTGENSFGFTKPYGEWIRKFGQLVVLMPDDPIREDLDLLILPGGLDVSPSRQSGYNLSLYTGNSNPMLEYFDKHILPEYIQHNTPILGICRGAQSLYTMFGGVMNQHNFTHIQSEHPKHQVHGLGWITEELHEKYSGKVQMVNSRHHQTMIWDQNNPNIEVMAIAREYYNTKTENGKSETKYTDYADIVEVFKIKDKNIFGVQYHPEDNVIDNFTPELVLDLLKIKQDD